MIHSIKVEIRSLHIKACLINVKFKGFFFFFFFQNKRAKNSTEQYKGQYKMHLKQFFVVQLVCTISTF